MIDIDELEKELNEFFHMTPSKANFMELIQRTRATESKLAEMEKQEPVGYIHEIDLEHLQETGKGKIYRDRIHDSITVYADPKPSYMPEDKKYEISERVLKFLHGVGMLNHCSFSETPPNAGKFWWRKYLPSLDQ